MGRFKENEVKKLNYQLRHAPISMPLRTPISRNNLNIQLYENELKKEENKEKR